MPAAESTALRIFCALPVQTSPTFNPFIVTRLLPFLECHKTGIIGHGLFKLASLNSHLKSMLSYGLKAHLFLAQSILLRLDASVVRLPAEDVFPRVRVFVISHKAAGNICVQAFVWMGVSVHLGEY